MSKCGGWLGLAIVAGAALGNFACWGPGERELEAGRRALMRGQYREAIIHYAEATLQAPGSPCAAQALYDTGVIQYVELRDLDAARSTFRKVLSEFPESAVTWDARRMLARMYEQELGSPEKAIREYRQLLDKVTEANDRRPLLLSLANCYYLLNDLQTAADIYRRAVDDFQYDQRTDDAFLRLALIETLAGRRRDALGVLEALLESSDQPESRYRAFVAEAEILLGASEYRSVSVCLSRANREFPGDQRLAELAMRVGGQERDGRSLDDGDRESREILEVLQSSIRWGRRGQAAREFR